MKEGRGRILIARSFSKRGLQKNTVERILNLLSNISKKSGREMADKQAEKMIKIIEDERNSEAEIIAYIEKMEQNPNTKVTQ